MAYTMPREGYLGPYQEPFQPEKTWSSFDEARELFVSDVDYLELPDDAHSEAEDRFIAIGPIRRGLVLVRTRRGRDQNHFRALGDQV